MKRFHVTLDQLNKGLRRHSQSRINSFEFFDLYNLKPTPFGLVPYHPVEQAISFARLEQAGLIEDWPFPQLFIGKRYVILAGSTKIYLVNRYDYNQPLIELPIYDADNPSSLTSIDEGRAWQFVDMQDSWILSNGVNLVIYPGKDTMIGNGLKCYVKKGVSIEAIAYWKGRIVIGGFDPTNFWSSEWESFWNSWSKKVTDTGLSTSYPWEGQNVTMPMYENFIWYSQIDGGDFLFLFFPELAKQGYLSTSYGEEKPILFDLMKRGDGGFLSLMGRGKVRELLPLGDFLIAYQDEAVIALSNEIDPDPHVGQRFIYGHGIKGHAVAGNKLAHAFIERGGSLTVITADLKTKVEGYKEFLSQFREQEVLAFHSSDPADLSSIGDFYFCSSQRTYVYNGELFETGQILRSVIYDKGVTKGITNWYGEDADEARVGIDVADFADHGLKQIDSIKVSLKENGEGGAPIQTSVAVDYLYKVNGEWSTSSYVGLNNNGEAYLPVSGLNFKFRVKVDAYGRVEKFWSFTAAIKFVDRRYTRSVNFGQITS